MWYLCALKVSEPCAEPIWVPQLVWDTSSTWSNIYSFISILCLPVSLLAGMGQLQIVRVSGLDFAEYLVHRNVKCLFLTSWSRSICLFKPLRSLCLCWITITDILALAVEAIIKYITTLLLIFSINFRRWKEAKSRSPLIT